MMNIQIVIFALQLFQTNSDHEELFQIFQQQEEIHI